MVGRWLRSQAGRRGAKGGSGAQGALLVGGWAEIGWSGAAVVAGKAGLGREYILEGPSGTWKSPLVGPWPRIP